MNMKKFISTVLAFSIAAIPTSGVQGKHSNAAETSFLARNGGNIAVAAEDTDYYDDFDETDEYGINTGSISIYTPEKTIYKIGEELDLTHGEISGYGAVTVYSDKHPNGTTAANWDIFTRDLKLTDLDTSEFDNTKVGIYKIKAARQKSFGASYPIRDNVKYDSFYVMVVDGEPTEEDEKKLSDIEATKYIAEGTVKIKQPDKTVYKVGEKLDLTGCTISGNGNVFKGSYNDHSSDYIGEWSIESRPVTRDDLKNPYVNMQKAGTYSLSLDRLRSINGYEITDDNITYDKINIEVVGDTVTTSVGDTGSAVTTTTVTTVDTGTKKTIVYTGGMAYDVLGVNTYPTQTVFLEGEEFNSIGLNVKCQRYIPYEKLGLNRDEYEPQPISDSDVEVAAVSVSLIDENGEVHNATRMCQLPAGKYRVQFDARDAMYANYNVGFRNSGISYDIEIKSSDLLPEKTVPSGEKKIFGYTHNYDQKFKGVAQYPKKVVYKQGDDLDLSGLIIKAQRVIPYETIFLSPSDYEEEPIYLKTRLPQTDAMEITAADGTAYNGTELSTLGAGKYTVSCKAEGMNWGSRDEHVFDVDLSYDIEIVSKEEYDKIEAASPKGDANCDGQVDMADIVLIMQALANPNKYGVEGSADTHLTEKGLANADLDGDGLTVGDAQAIQRKLLGLPDDK